MLTVDGHINPSNALMAYYNADHTSSPDHGWSITGYVIFAGQGAISWSAKKHTAMAWSTTKAKYYTSVHVGQEIAWLHHLLSEIRMPSTQATMLNIDNTSAIRMITCLDKITHCNKHVCLAYHWVREATEEETLHSIYDESSKNIADILMRSLPCEQHSKLTIGLGVHTHVHS